MQHTHECLDHDYEYPENLDVKDVNVYIHPSGMFMTHDYSCPVCRENHAVISNGIMQPCWECQKIGYELIKKDLNKKWWSLWK